MIDAEIIPNCGISSSVENDTSAVFSNYFIASKDGKHFSHISAGDVESALAQNMFVYVVDDPTVAQPVDFYLGGENTHLNDETCNSGASNTVLYLDSTTVPVVTPTTGLNIFQQVSIPPIDQLVIPPVASTSHLNSSDNVIPIITPPLCATAADNNYHLTTSTLEMPLNSNARKQKRTSRIPNTSRICTVCQKVFTTLRGYSNHMVTHENERPHACLHCSQTFNQMINLKIHLAVHHYNVSFGEPINSKSIFVCPVCDCKPFSRRAAFHAHLLTHQCEETINCILCQKVFLSVSLLNAHISTEHSSISVQENDDQVQLTTTVPIKNGYRCQKCGHVFSSAGLIRRHYRFDHPTLIHNNQSVNKNTEMKTMANTRDATNEGNMEGPRLSKLRAVAYVNAIIKKQQRHPSTGISHYDEFIHKLPEDDAPAPASEQIPSNQSSRKRGKRRTFPCSVCKRLFISRCMLARHMLKHTKSKPFECRICHTRFSQKSSVKTHLALHTNQSRQACPLCKRRFKFSTNLVLHLQSVHHVKAEIVENVEVDLDNTQCTTENAIVWQYQPVVPALNIQRDDPVLTEKPTEIFDRYSQQATLDQDRPYSCSVCHKQFTLRRSLSIHMLRHSPANLPYACHMCPRRFATLAHKNYHVATHSTQAARRAARLQRLARLKAWKLSEVNRFGPLVWSSSQKAYVGVDDKKRLKVRPHACSYCPKAYLHMHHLSLHIRQQHCPNRAPYACDRCTRRFTSEAGLSRHVATKHLSSHSKIQRFTCNVCLVTFSVISSLRRHMLVHTTEKSYKCHICHRKFRHLSSCRRHINRHVDDNTVTGLFSTSLEANKNDSELVENSVIGSNSQRMELTTTGIVESMTDINTGNFNFADNKLSNYSDFDGVMPYDDQNSKILQSTVPTLYPVVYISDEQQALSTIPVNGVYYVPTNGSAAVGSVAFEGLHDGAPDMQHGTLLSTVEMPPTDPIDDVNDSIPKNNWSLYLTYHETDGSCELPHEGKTLPMVDSGIAETFNPNILNKDGGDQLAVGPLPYPDTSDIPDFIANASYIIDLDVDGSNVNTAYEPHAAYIDNVHYQPVTDESIDVVEKTSNSEYDVDINTELSEPVTKVGQPTDMDATITTPEVSTGAVVEYYGCGRCSATFSTGPELQKHNQLYHFTMPTPYSCSHCLKAFASEVLLQAHEQLNHGPSRGEGNSGEKPLLHCPACKTITTTSSALTRHILACHPMSSPDPFRCTDCGLTFRYLRCLKVHVRTKIVSNSVNEVSPVKKKERKASTEMKRKTGRPPKMQTSESERATSDAIRLSVGATTCPVCGRNFKLSSDLKRHMSVHSGVRPHPCPHCPRSFLIHCQLQRHLNSAHANVASQQSEPRPTPKPGDESKTVLPMATESPGAPSSLTNSSPSDMNDKWKPQTEKELSESTSSFSDVMATEPTGQTSSDFSHPLKLQPFLPLIDPSDFDKSLLDFTLPSDPSLTPFMLPAAADLETFSFKTVISCKKCHERFPNSSAYKAHTCCHLVSASSSSSTASGTNVGKAGEVSRTSTASVRQRPWVKSRRFDPLHRCLYCGKTFSQAWLLRRHEAGHVKQPSGVLNPDDGGGGGGDCDKPFQCPYCAQGFAQCGNMKRHMSTVHRGGN